MKLWILRPVKDLPSTIDNPWHPWYDKCFGFVVRAETEAVAREIANRHGGCENERWHNSYKEKLMLNPWLYEKYSTCTELTVDGPQEMIIEDVSNA